MRKLSYIVVSILLLLFSMIFFIRQKTIIFVYTNPYIQTSGLKYISNVVKNIDNVMNLTRYSMLKNGMKINYLYQNPYGSGFLRNNPIPNDLDYAVGIDLGEYVYDKNNAEQLAKEIVDKINAFQFNLSVNLESELKNSLYTTFTPFSILRHTNNNYNKNVEDIVSAINYITTNQNYVKYTIMDSTDESNKIVKITFPYIMRSNEILLRDTKQLYLYSDKISYYPEMKKYLREFTINLEYYATLITSDNKKLQIEIVPETFKGTRLQLSRRCFSSSVFIDSYSSRFLNNVSWLNNDDDYLYFRMLTFRRHLQEIIKITNENKSPAKALKRIMQTTDAIQPVITPEKYNEISQYVQNNLSNQNIVLLNEYSNIVSNIVNIVANPNTLTHAINDGKISNMESVMVDLTQQLQSRNTIDEQTLLLMQDFNTTTKAIATQKLETTIDSNKMGELLKDKKNVLNQHIVKLMLSNMKNPEKIQEYVKFFRGIYSDIGYHEVRMFWLNDGNIGILKDEFTKNISDLKDFSRENALAEANYKLITENQIPKISIKYTVWAKYNLLGRELEKYNEFRSRMLADRKNFNKKYKIVFIK